MTCVVAVTDGTTVTMGGDSCFSDDTTHGTIKHPKVFRVGEFVIGASGSLRVMQTIRYSFEPPPPPARNVDRYMSTEFVAALRDALRAAGTLKIKNGVEESPESDLLVGLRGRIYLVQEDFQATRCQGDYLAIGSGDLVALGALEVTKDWEARDRVHAALKASAKHCTGVSGPFRYVSG